MSATTINGGAGDGLTVHYGGNVTGATLSAGYVLQADTNATLQAGAVTISRGTVLE